MTLPMLVWARQPASQLQAPGLRHGGAGRPRPAVLRPRGPGTVGSGFCRPSVLAYRELERGGGSTGSAEQAPHQDQPPGPVGPAPGAAVVSHSPPTGRQAEGRQLDLASQRPGARQRARSAPPWPALWAQDPGRRQGIDQTRQPPSHWLRPEATGRAWPTPRLGRRSGATPQAGQGRDSAPTLAALKGRGRPLSCRVKRSPCSGKGC